MKIRDLRKIPRRLSTGESFSLDADYKDPKIVGKSLRSLISAVLDGDAPGTRGLGDFRPEAPSACGNSPAVAKEIKGMGSDMKYACLAKLFAVALFASVGGASAATITVNGPVWTDPDLRRFDFSRLPVCGQTGDLDTEVGRFSARGGPGEKGTVCGDPSRAQVRQGTPEYIALSGRHGSPFWLDSNDNTAIDFKLRRSRGVQFLSSDLADIHGFFRIEAGNASYEINTKQPNGGLWLFTVLFDPGEDRSISLISTRNDGFSIGPVTLAPIPLPATGLMLIGGVGALVAARRRRRRRAVA